MDILKLAFVFLHLVLTFGGKENEEMDEEIDDEVKEEVKGAKLTFVELGIMTHVTLVTSKAGICSGSIINEEFVLTAAHCLVTISSHNFLGYQSFSWKTLKDNAVKVSTGIVNMLKTGSEHKQVRTSKELILHPYFSAYKLGGYDLALIRVSPPFVFGDVVFQVEISEKGWPQNSSSLNSSNPISCVSSGFGDTTVPEHMRLRMWDVGALHGERSCPCTKHYQWLRLICPDPGEEPVDLCSGDGGGGLICEDKIVGVAHMVRDRQSCKNLEYPHCKNQSITTYTYLCPFNDWIRLYVPNAPPTPVSCLACFTFLDRQILAVIVMLHISSYIV